MSSQFETHTYVWHARHTLHRDLSLEHGAVLPSERALRSLILNPFIDRSLRTIKGYLPLCLGLGLRGYP
jgi:hypothetical protein